MLHLPLELGVQVIAAHGAGRSALFDKDYTSDLLKMLNKYPNLFIDNSALASINRWPTIKHLLSPSVQKRVVHGRLSDSLKWIGTVFGKTAKF